MAGVPQHAFSIPDDATCLTCGYSLRELTVPRCPECGKAFDPADVLSFQSEARIKMVRQQSTEPLPVVAFVVVTFFATCLLIPLLSIGRAFRNDENQVLAVFPAAALGLIARSYARKWQRIDDSPQAVAFQRRMKKWLWWTVAGTMVLFLGKIWTCPHGTGLQIGPIAFTITGPDGMCRNEVHLGHRHQLTERLSFYFID